MNYLAQTAHPFISGSGNNFIPFSLICYADSYSLPDLILYTYIFETVGQEKNLLCGKYVIKLQQTFPMKKPKGRKERPLSHILAAVMK
jgi:hypothetical protein